jgi:hypothetical protein
MKGHVSVQKTRAEKTILYVMAAQREEKWESGKMGIFHWCFYQKWGNGAESFPWAWLQQATLLSPTEMSTAELGQRGQETRALI